MKEESLPLKYSSRVLKARTKGIPMLALESTVLTHGLPYPQNLDVLSRLESLCRDNGAEPATIIVLDGAVHIGMDDCDLARLREIMQKGDKLEKLGRRDLPTALVKGQSGGTTVSATMLLAQRAGIKVFATGGIGGVHRGWESSMDISNDLKTLSEIPVIVVSAGCKAILDIGATLEYLETLGVPVMGWQVTDFPAFYSRHSGHKIDSVYNAAQVAEIYRTTLSWERNPGGILIANPIPSEAEIPAAEIAVYIEAAIADAARLGISGKATTPFLLDALAKSTQGLSVKANLALLENNVMIGAQIARELM